MMGSSIGEGGLYDYDDDYGDGWHGDMMMSDLHLMVERHFRFRIIPLATISLTLLGSSVKFSPMCTKSSLAVLDDC